MVAEKGMLKNFRCRYEETDKSQADDLQASGQESVYMTTLYAVVGAIALERGGEAANKVCQEQILSPLGFTFTTDI